MILNKENMRNKKVILILCLLVLVSGSVQAQRLKAVQNEKGRYGFMTEDGTVVIKYRYDEATPFKDGIAKIGKDGKYSLINEDGEIITKRKYTYIGEFYNGVCPVAEGGNTEKGVMLTTGRVFLAMKSVLQVGLQVCVLLLVLLFPNCSA